MPSTDPEKIREKRERDNERRRQQRSNPDYREAEREKDRERKRGERKRDREQRQGYIADALEHFVDDWEAYDWENEYVRKRGGNEAYRPWLKALHESDRKRGTVRLNVYETTPLAVDRRAEYQRVWQTYRSATIQIPGLPLIKRFKVLDPKDPNPVPIGEGELVRRYLGSQTRRRHIFPKSLYEKVTDSPKYFVPQNAPDLIEWGCEYIDLSRCYSQLLERLPSLGVQFHYGRHIFQPIDHLPPHSRQLLASKHWGRATLGMLRQPKGRCFIYGEPKTFPSRFFHGDTSNWVHAILHCLASYAVYQCGCFRWHTDGGFFPIGGGTKFARLLGRLGIQYTLEEYAAVVFASLDQYEAVRSNGTVKQTKHFTSTYVSDFIFMPSGEGGGQRNNVIKGLDSRWLFSTLEQTA